MKVFCLCLALAASVGCSVGSSREVGATHAPHEPGGRVEASVKQEQTTDNEVAASVRRLRSADEGERERAKKELRLLASKSARSRKQVIQELIKVTGESDARLRVTSAQYYDAWKFATELLGELKATEALDVLIECIDCNDGFAGLSFDHYPALKAITVIGEPAVPKLTAALNHDRAATRSAAASALGTIGGAEAMEALESALRQERDENVIAHIRIALRRH